MAKTFDLKDDSVVVVVGSGAGGGTLSNELVQRGINVVCLEAGARPGLTHIINHNGAPFNPPSLLRKRLRAGRLHPAIPLCGLQTPGGTTAALAGAAARLP